VFATLEEEQLLAKLSAGDAIAQLLLTALIRNESGRFGALKSDSTHHFFRNACLYTYEF
jgi:hypothetical protein